MEKIILTTDSLNEWLEKYQTTKNFTEKNRIKTLVISSCMPLVKKLSYSLARRSSDPVEDIIQIGSIGLIKAIDLYKINENSNFKAFAKCYIIGEIKHYLRDNSKMIKTSRSMQELSYKINKLSEDLTQKLGHFPSDKEIAEALQIPKEQITECTDKERRTTVISLSQNDNSDDNSLSFEDKLEDENEKQKMLSYENRMVLEEALNELPQLEQELISYYFYDDMTLNEIALRLNISQLQASKRLNFALEKLFEIVSAKGLEEFIE